jgi:hypothetical protein
MCLQVRVQEMLSRQLKEAYLTIKKKEELYLSATENSKLPRAFEEQTPAKATKLVMAM